MNLACENIIALPPIRRKMSQYFGVEARLFLTCYSELEHHLNSVSQKEDDENIKFLLLFQDKNIRNNNNNNNNKHIMQSTLLFSRFLLVLAAYFCIFPYRHATRAYKTTVYWQLQPYIYTDPRTGILTGVLVETLERAREYTCNITSLDYYVRFQETSLLNMNQNLVYQVPLNVTLFPVFYSNSSNPAGVAHYEAFTSESVSVIARRSAILYSSKYFRSFFKLGMFLYLVVFFILGAAALITLAVSC